MTLALVAAAAQPRRGEIANRAHAEMLLSKEAPGCSAKALVGRLIRAGLLDELPSGRIAFHDFEQWQTRSPSDHPEAVKQRVRQHRAKGDVTRRKVVTGNDVTTIDRERDPLAKAREGLDRDDAPAPYGGAPFDLEDEALEVDLELVKLLLDPEGGEDPALVARMAALCLASKELMPALVAEEVAGLRELVKRGRP